MGCAHFAPATTSLVVDDGRLKILGEVARLPEPGRVEHQAGGDQAGQQRDRAPERGSLGASRSAQVEPELQ